MLRSLLFWVGCLGIRSLAAWTAYVSPTYTPLLGWIASLIALGFTIIYLGGLRETGPEVFGERIWWNDMRPVHAALYGLFAYLAIHEHPRAWTVLALDVVLGAAAKLFYRTIA
jgi:hypothetical protein